MAKDPNQAARPPSFRNLMTFRLHMLARLSERFSERYYRKHMDLSLPEGRVIGITASHGSVSFKQLAIEADLEKSYASRVISNLVDRGIVEKQANPADSRSVVLALTGRGRKIHEEMYGLARRLNQTLQAPFTSDEVDAFLAFLARLEQQLDVATELLEHGGDGASLDGGAPMPDAAGADASFMLDRRVARQLHAALGRYLTSGS